MNQFRKTLIAVLCTLCLVCGALFVSACVMLPEDEVYYTVTLNYNEEQGTVTKSDPESPAGYVYGENVTITVTPNEGYEVGVVTVNGFIATLTDGTCSFPVTGKTTVNVTFEGEPVVTPDDDKVILPEELWGTYVCTVYNYNYEAADASAVADIVADANGTLWGDSEILLNLEEESYGNIYNVVVNGTYYTLTVNVEEKSISLATLDWSEEYYFVAEGAAEATYTVTVVYNLGGETVEEGAVGTVVVCGENYAEDVTEFKSGETVYLVIYANPGYEVDVVTVNGEALYLNEYEEYSFVIDSNSVVAVTYKELAQSPLVLGEDYVGTYVADGNNTIVVTENGVKWNENIVYEVESSENTATALLVCVDGVYYDLVLTENTITLYVVGEEAMYTFTLVEAEEEDTLFTAAQQGTWNSISGDGKIIIAADEITYLKSNDGYDGFESAIRAGSLKKVSDNVFTLTTTKYGIDDLTLTFKEDGTLEITCNCGGIAFVGFTAVKEGSEVAPSTYTVTLTVEGASGNNSAYLDPEYDNNTYAAGAEVTLWVSVYDGYVAVVTVNSEPVELDGAKYSFTVEGDTEIVVTFTKEGASSSEEQLIVSSNLAGTYYLATENGVDENNYIIIAEDGAVTWNDEIVYVVENDDNVEDEFYYVVFNGEPYDLRIAEGSLAIMDAGWNVSEYKLAGYTYEVTVSVTVVDGAEELEGYATVEFAPAAEGNKYEYGAKVTVTVTAANGVTVSTVTVNGEDALPVVSHVGNVYTYEFTVEGATVLRVQVNGTPVVTEPDTYTVTVDESVEGVIEVLNDSGENVTEFEAGATVWIAVQAPVGYEVVSVTANGAEVAYDEANSVYTFVITADVTVVVTYKALDQFDLQLDPALQGVYNTYDGEHYLEIDGFGYVLFDDEFVFLVGEAEEDADVYLVRVGYEGEYYYLSLEKIAENTIVLDGCGYYSATYTLVKADNSDDSDYPYDRFPEKLLGKWTSDSMYIDFKLVVEEDGITVTSVNDGINATVAVEDITFNEKNTATNFIFTAKLGSYVVNFQFTGSAVIVSEEKWAFGHELSVHNAEDDNKVPDYGKPVIFSGTQVGNYYPEDFSVRLYISISEIDFYIFTDDIMPIMPDEITKNEDGTFTLVIGQDIVILTFVSDTTITLSCKTNRSYNFTAKKASVSIDEKYFGTWKSGDGVITIEITEDSVKINGEGVEWIVIAIEDNNVLFIEGWDDRNWTLDFSTGSEYVLVFAESNLESTPDAQDAGIATVAEYAGYYELYKQGVEYVVEVPGYMVGNYRGSDGSTLTINADGTVEYNGEHTSLVLIGVEYSEFFPDSPGETTFVFLMDGTTVLRGVGDNMASTAADYVGFTIKSVSGISLTYTLIK